MDFLAGLAKAAQPKPSSDQAKESDNDLLSSAKLVAEAAQAQFNHQPDKVDNTKVAGAAAHLLDAATQYGKLDETQGVGKYLGEAEGYLRKYSASGEPTETPVADAAPAASVDEKKAPAAAPVDEKKAPVEEETAPPSEEKIPPTAAAADVPYSDSTTEEKPAADTPAAESEEPAPTKKIEADPEKEKPVAADDIPASEPEKPAPTKKIEAEPEEEKTVPTATETETEKAPAAAGGEDYVKLAEGLLNKTSGGEGPGAADYVKLAEGFLDKKTGDGESVGGGYSGLANLAGGFLKK